MIGILFLVATVLWFIYDKLTHRGYPPGPMRLPIFGSIFQMMRLSPFPAVAFQQLAEKYGDVFFLKIGFSEIVVFNSEKTIQEIRSHELAGSLRCPETNPTLWERCSKKNLGIATGNGNEWQSLRRFTIRTLRDFGFGKAASMEVAVNEEVDKFIKCIESEMKTFHLTGELPETNRYYNLSLMNTVWRLVTGVNYELTDRELHRLLDLNEEFFKCSNFGVELNISFPFLFDLFPNWLGKHKLVKNLDQIREFLRDSVEARRQTGDCFVNPNCYVDIFLGKIEQEKNKECPDPAFTYEQLVMCLFDLFQAGGDTGSTALKYCMLHMLMHPEIQAKIHKEIDEMIGKDEEITIESKNKLPFTYATLLECMRYTTIVPLLIPTVSLQDFYYNGFLIKKGIPLNANIHAVHMDKKIWGDPDNFRPDRFLTNGGELDVEAKGHMMSFGYGTRQCLGYIIADNIVFIYFASILKRFKLEKASKEEVLTTEPDSGFTNIPKPFKVKYIPRN